jgi:hypothetical protein
MEVLIGISSISMGHGFHGYVSHNQRVSIWISIPVHWNHPKWLMLNVGMGESITTNNHPIPLFPTWQEQHLFYTINNY